MPQAPWPWPPKSQPQPAQDPILQIALDVMTSALDELAGACIGPDGRPQAPDKRALMRARAMLPQKFSQSLHKKASPCESPA